MSANEQSKPPSLLKWVGIPVFAAIVFMGILYLAMETEPDYMPAQQKKAQGVDVHAKHANAQSDEHAQHSEAEHQEVISNEHSSH